MQLVALLLEWMVSCHQLMCERVELSEEQWSPILTFIPECELVTHTVQSLITCLVITVDRTCSNYRELTLLIDEVSAVIQRVVI